MNTSISRRHAHVSLFRISPYWFRWRFYEEFRRHHIISGALWSKPQLLMEHCSSTHEIKAIWWHWNAATSLGGYMAMPTSRPATPLLINATLRFDGAFQDAELVSTIAKRNISPDTRLAFCLAPSFDAGFIYHCSRRTDSGRRLPASKCRTVPRIEAISHIQPLPGYFAKAVLLLP